MTENTPELDVLIIGGGQAGLAMGSGLKETPVSFRIVERHPRVGDSWRNRYASLVLFTPRAYSALPGLAVPGDPEGYPTKDEMADYLEAYAERFDLPVAPGTGIRRLERAAGGFRATTEAGEPIDSRAVVLATGAFQRPAIPPISKRLSEEVAQLAPEAYRAPDQLAAGRVLVVGDGATGRQIALELTANHEVLLAAGRHRRVSPDRILWKSVFWWMDKLGVLRASRESRIGNYLMKADPFPGKRLELDELRQRGVDVVGRVTQAGFLRRREGGRGGRGGVGDRLQGRRRLGGDPRGQGRPGQFHALSRGFPAPEPVLRRPKLAVDARIGPLCGCRRRRRVPHGAPRRSL
jgi:putative flavoprotein involved in K+ transport